MLAAPAAVVSSFSVHRGVGVSVTGKDAPAGSTRRRTTACVPHSLELVLSLRPRRPPRPSTLRRCRAIRPSSSGRRIICRAFSVIRNSPLRIDLSCVLDQVVSELTAFLRKATLGTLNSLVVTYGGQIGSSSYETILAELSTLISDMDLPQALILIRSALLQGQALQELQRLFTSLFQSANSAAKPSQSGGLAKQALSPIAKCVAVLCLAAGDQKCASHLNLCSAM
ncbi:hypothetical protein ACP4OV_024704 [Aristida adscensionis]